MASSVAGAQVVGVLCDLDGVLLDYHRAEQQAFAGVAMRLGLHDVDAARGVYAGINRDLWDAYERGEVSAEELRVRRWQEWLAAHDLEPREATRVSGTYLDLLTRSPAVMPGAVQALRTMARHVPVVAVTNGFAEVAHGRLTASGTRADLRGVVAADDVGAPKPAPAMFAAGLALLGDPAPGSVLMVGDNHHDMEEARNGGAGLAIAVLSGNAAHEDIAHLADHKGHLSACNEAYARLAASMDPPLSAVAGPLMERPANHDSRPNTSRAPRISQRQSFCRSSISA